MLFGGEGGTKARPVGGKCGNLFPKWEEKPPGQNTKEWTWGHL